MPLRTRLFIIISIVVLLILGVAVLLLVQSNKSSTPAPTGTNTGASPITNGTVGGGTAGIPSGLPIKPATAAEVERAAIKQLAKIFVERFNTFSSDSNYQNIRDVQSLVSSDYWKKLAPRLQVPVVVTSTYIGVTTEAVVATVNTLKDGAATVTIKTRRTTSQGGIDSVAYSTVTVTLVKVNSAWLIDSQTITP